MSFDYIRLVRDDFSEGMVCEVYLEEWKEVDHGDKEALRVPATLGASSHFFSWFSLSVEYALHFYPVCFSTQCRHLSAWKLFLNLSLFFFSRMC